MAISFLKKRLLENIKRREFNYIGEHEIRWVLTVPAMWSEKAKQYMREAAEEVWIT
jgi:vacuolar-type H+-ATPase subunit F/Vma7